MSCTQRSFVFAATFFALAALGLGLTSLLHERWLDIKVQNISRTTQHYEYYPRSRGLLWVCVPLGSNVLAVKSSEVVYGRCFQEDLGQKPPTGAGPNYWHIIHLRRTVIGLKSASLFINVVGLLLGFATLLQWCLHSSKGSSVYRRCRGVIIGAWIFAALLDLSSLALYHYYMDLEKYLRNTGLVHIYANWDAKLKQITEINLDIMYFFEWGVIGLLVLAALLFLMSLCLYPEDKYGRGKSGNRGGTSDDRTYLYHNNPMIQMSSESLPPYEAYKSGTGVSHATAPTANHQDDGQSARSGQSSRRLPRYTTDGSYQDNQAKNVYRIY